ncbi:MAG TPA: spermidine synthase [Polyangia bacterium]|nr:spermidine synthase [Polyangia bacterium]
MQPWRTIDRVETPEGPLELRQRGERDFLITIAGRILMTSVAHRSEEALAEIACGALPPGTQPRVLVGGLGMGYTLRAALDRLPPRAKVDLVDLNPAVVTWCRGPLAPLTAAAIDDRRVSVEVADVARVITAAPAGSYDAILLDLYEGPHQATNHAHDPLYGAAALERTHRALRPGGTLAIWSEEVDRPFERRLAAAHFRVRTHRTRGGRTHVIYAGTTG